MVFSRVPLGIVACVLGLAVGSAQARTYCEPSTDDRGRQGASAEDTQSHDAYSNDWRNETQITGSPSVITGSWSGSNDYDLIYLTGLDAGAQTLTFTFSVPTGVTPNWRYSAGGAVLYSTSDYRWSAWEGTLLGYVGLSYWDLRDDVLTLSLGADFTGTLHLGLYGTYGVLDYTITGMRYASAPLVTLPLDAPAVPLPAPVMLLTAGIALLGTVALRGRTPT